MYIHANIPLLLILEVSLNLMTRTRFPLPARGAPFNGGRIRTAHTIFHRIVIAALSIISAGINPAENSVVAAWSAAGIGLKRLPFCISFVSALCPSPPSLTAIVAGETHNYRQWASIRDNACSDPFTTMHHRCKWSNYVRSFLTGAGICQLVKPLWTLSEDLGREDSCTCTHTHTHTLGGKIVGAAFVPFFLRSLAPKNGRLSHFVTSCWTVLEF